MKKIIIVALGLALAGCGNAQVNEAKTVVKEQLTDPASAQFENVVVQKTMMVGETIQPVAIPATCGWVNGANRIGGMAGAERFIVKAGVRTFRDDSGTWAEEFSNCVIHSDDQAATDRLTREGTRAMDAYEDAVEGLNKAD